MRSRRTTYLLLLLALLFILVIIILCLIPEEKDPRYPPKHGGSSKNKLKATEPSTTASSTLTTVTLSDTTKHPTTPVQETSSLGTETTDISSTTASTTEIPTSTIPTTMGVTSTTVQATTETTSTTMPTTAEATSTTMPTTAEITTSAPPITDIASTTISTSEITSTTISSTSDIASTTKSPAKEIASSTTPTTAKTTSTIVPTTAEATSTNIPTTTETTSTTIPTTTEIKSTTITTTNETTSTTIPTTTEKTSTTMPTTTETASTTIPTTTEATSTIIPTTEVTSTTVKPTTEITSTSMPTTVEITSTSLPTTEETTTEYSHDFKLYKELKGICTSSECRDVAAKMLDSIDHSVDECQNFYEYSCGGVKKDQFLLAEDPEEVLNSIIRKQLPTSETDSLKFYESCINSFAPSDFLSVFPELKIISSSTEYDSSPTETLSRMLSNFLKLDIPLLFDVKVDIMDDSGAKFVPRIELLPSRVRTFSSHYVDSAVCSSQFDERIKETQRNGEFKLDFNHDYNNVYLDCMNSTGIDARIKFIEKVVKEFEMFEKSWSSIEKQFIFLKLKTFMGGFQEVMSNLVVQKDQKSEQRITLEELKNDPKLGNLINWDIFFTNLLGTKQAGSQLLIISSKDALSQLFHYITENKTSSSDLEIFIQMLAAERLYVKHLPTAARSSFCLKITKQLLPEDMLLLFAKSFSKPEAQKLTAEIKMLASNIASEFASLNFTSETFNFENFSAIHKVYPEFIDVTTTEANIRKRKEAVNLTSKYLENIRKLQEKKRIDMYTLLSKASVTQKYCKFLPLDLQSRCNLQHGKISIPISNLVAPNFYYEDEMPNYLRLAGVSTYIAKALAHDVSDFDLEGYENEDCIANKFPNTFIVKMKNNVEVTYHIEGKENAQELFKDFKISQIVWRVLRKLASENLPSSLNETNELPLIWMGEEALQPLKAFLIRKAQTFCRDSIGFEFLSTAVNNNKYPNSFWINTLLQTDALFATSFKCPSHTPMGLQMECKPPILFPSVKTKKDSHGFPLPFGFISTTTDSSFVIGRHPQN